MSHGIVAVALLVTPALTAGTFTFFGSLGAEAQLLPSTANVADAVLYGDAKQERWKAHIKVRGEASDRGADRLQLGEGLVQANVRPWLALAAGRVIEKWGTGYAWNPTAFVSPPKNPSDPTDRRFAYRGVDMLRADVFVHDTSLSLYALRDHAFAARAYRLVGGTDLSLYLRRDGDGTQQGVSAARVFGDALELHGEAARRHLLLGGQYTFHSNVNVVGELYRSGEGPAATARNYAFARADWPSSNQKTDLELMAIVSLHDRSSIARATLTRKLRPNLAVYVIDTELLGAAGSELAYLHVRRLTTFGARVYF